MVICLIRGPMFSEPVKRIYDSQGAYYFQSSEAIRRLEGAIVKYTDLVESRDVADLEFSGVVGGVVKVLDRLDQLVSETPPIPGPRRYGNMACRDWHEKIEREIPGLLEDLISTHFPSELQCVVELRYYLANSFGSATRLDFGTGHELSFLATVAALDMLGASFDGDQVLYIFDRYYSLVHRLILSYTLEPAGSHGVWGLDDHFHLAYILGSSQWCNRKQLAMEPNDLSDPVLVEQYSRTNIFCKTLNFVFTVKSGAFREHSPMLFDISRSVRTWAKVRKGLWKMYKDEVLNKFPVIQHFWFGTGFYPWVDYKNGKPLPNYENSPDIDETNDLKTQAQANMDGTRVVESRFLSPGNETFVRRPQLPQDSGVGTMRSSTPESRLMNVTTRSTRSTAGPGQGRMGPPTSMGIVQTRMPSSTTSQAHASRLMNTPRQ